MPFYQNPGKKSIVFSVNNRHLDCIRGPDWITDILGGSILRCTNPHHCDAYRPRNPLIQDIPEARWTAHRIVGSSERPTR